MDIVNVYNPIGQALIENGLEFMDLTAEMEKTIHRLNEQKAAVAANMEVARALTTALRSIRSIMVTD